MTNNKLKTNYTQTIFNIVINLCLTLWLFLFFILELNEFINPIKNPDGSSTQTIPLLSTLGIIAWFGLFRKKHWGLYCFLGYIVFTIGYQLLDLVSNFGLPTIIQIISTSLISILLYLHFKKHLGFVWIVKNHKL